MSWFAAPVQRYAPQAGDVVHVKPYFDKNKPFEAGMKCEFFSDGFWRRANVVEIEAGGTAIIATADGTPLRSNLRNLQHVEPRPSLAKIVAVEGSRCIVHSVERIAGESKEGSSGEGHVSSVDLSQISRPHGWDYPKAKSVTDVQTLQSWSQQDRVLTAVTLPAPPIKVAVAVEGETTQVKRSLVFPTLPADAAVQGARVYAYWNAHQSKLYAAVITGVDAQQRTASLLYDDGDKKPAVPLDHLVDLEKVQKIAAAADHQALSSLLGEGAFAVRVFRRSAWCTGQCLGVLPAGGTNCSPPACDPSINDLVTLWRGDITELNASAIQNAANEGLNAGGGICGAIFAAAGRHELQYECFLHPVLERNTYGKLRCATGDTKITPGCALHAKHVLHTVGPRGEDPAALEQAYRSALDQSAERGFESIALCCISTGIFGYPPETAAPVAIAVVRKWLEEHKTSGHTLRRIIFCVFLKSDFDLYRHYMARFFPTTPNGASAAAAAGEATKQ